MEIFWFNCKYLIQYKLNEKYGIRYDINNLRLDSGYIIEGKISPSIKRGLPADIFVKVG
jgi:hypothetical protein